MWLLGLGREQSPVTASVVMLKFLLGRLVAERITSG